MFTSDWSFYLRIAFCAIAFWYLFAYLVVSMFIPQDNSTFRSQIRNVLQAPANFKLTSKSYNLVTQLGARESEYRLGVKYIFYVLRWGDSAPNENLIGITSRFVKNPTKDDSVEVVLSQLYGEQDTVRGYEAELRYNAHPECSVSVRCESKGLALIQAIIAWNKTFGTKRHESADKR